MTIVDEVIRAYREREERWFETRRDAALTLGLLLVAAAISAALLATVS